MKIVVVLVLLLAGILFATGAGFAFAKPRPKSSGSSKKDAAGHDRSWLEGVLDGVSLPSQGPPPLRKAAYSAGEEEIVGKGDALRPVKLRLTESKGCLEIHYSDNAPHDDSLGDQVAHLPRHEDEGKGGAPNETTIVLLKTGGRITFGPCAVHKSAGGLLRCQVVK